MKKFNYLKETVLWGTVLFSILISGCKNDYETFYPNIAYKFYDVILTNSTSLLIPVINTDFDINGDKINDFRIAAHFDKLNGDTTITAILLGDANNGKSNRFISYLYTFPGSQQINLIKVLNKGDQINSSSLDFTEYAGVTLSAYKGGSLFHSVGISDIGDKLVGFKFMIGSEVHYGWFTINLSEDKKVLIIKDGAYNKQADVEIGAGDK